MYTPADRMNCPDRPHTADDIATCGSVEACQMLAVCIGYRADDCGGAASREMVAALRRGIRLGRRYDRAQRRARRAWNAAHGVQPIP